MSGRPEESNDVIAGMDRDEAIPRLYDLHASMIRGLAWRLAAREDVADDIVQDTFLEAYRSWSRFEGRSKPETWLGGIAIHQWKRRMRRRVGEPSHFPSLQELLPFGETTSSVIPASEATPLDQAIRREAETAVHRAILELPDDFRVPLVMKEMLELSVDEVAEALDLNPQTVKSRLHRARLRIRAAMRSELPQSPAVDPAYDRQTCLDLMAAKLEALDAGRQFPVADEVICERCTSVFRELDLTIDLCRACDSLEIDPAERDRLLDAMGRGDGSTGADTN